MSDGVSSQKRGWFEVIQEKVNNEMSDEQFKEIRLNINGIHLNERKCVFSRNIQ